MATVFTTSEGYQQPPQMPYPTLQQPQQPQQPVLQTLHQTQQSYQQSYRQPVYLPPRNTFKTRNPTCFWVLVIIIVLIFITAVSSLVTYLMINWQVNRIRDADWDRQYGPDRWDPNKRPNW